MLVHLKSIGAIDAAKQEGDTDDFIERPAMLVYCGEFESADGPVKVTPDHLKLLVSNHNSALSKLRRLAAGATPLKHYPPIQLDHSTSARDTVGRLVGDLSLGEYDREDGEKVAAVFSRLRILGRENVEKVRDGRWADLSVGADFDVGKLMETSITPFPAAPGSSMLSAGSPEAKARLAAALAEGGACKDCMEKWMHHEKGEGTPHDKAVAIAISECKTHCKTQPLGADMNREKLKGYLTGHKKMTEKEAEEHLSRLEKAEHSEDLKKLTAEYDEHEKDKLTAHTAKMTAARARITTLRTDFKATTAKAKLAAATGKVLTRLSRLRASGKVTPAEIKKIDIAKLAASPDKEIDLVLGTYEAREPVIMAGQYGTVKGTNVSQLTAAQKKERMDKLEAEHRAHMSLLRKDGDAPLKLSGGAGGDAHTEGGAPPPVTTEHEHEKEAMAHLAQEHEEIHKMYAAGQHYEAKERLKAFMAKYMTGHAGHHEMADTSNEETEKHLSALAQSVEQMQAQFEEITQLTATVVA